MKNTNRCVTHTYTRMSSPAFPSFQTVALSIKLREKMAIGAAVVGAAQYYWQFIPFGTSAPLGHVGFAVLSGLGVGAVLGALVAIREAQTLLPFETSFLKSKFPGYSENKFDLRVAAWLLAPFVAGWATVRYLMPASGDGAKLLGFLAANAVAAYAIKAHAVFELTKWGVPL